MKSSEIFKFIDGNGEILVIRPDMTVPIARMVSAKMKNLPKPLKLFYITQVVRKNNVQIEKEWEFTQAGVEIIGIPSLEGDAEAIVTAIDSMKQMGLINIDGGVITLPQNTVKVNLEDAPILKRLKELREGEI